MDRGLSLSSTARPACSCTRAAPSASRAKTGGVSPLAATYFVERDDEIFTGEKPANFVVAASKGDACPRAANGARVGPRLPVGRERDDAHLEQRWTHPAQDHAAQQRHVAREDKCQAVKRLAADDDGAVADIAAVDCRTLEPVAGVAVHQQEVASRLNVSRQPAVCGLLQLTPVHAVVLQDRLQKDLDFRSLPIDGLALEITRAVTRVPRARCTASPSMSLPPIVNGIVAPKPSVLSKT